MLQHLKKKTVRLNRDLIEIGGRTLVATSNASKIKIEELYKPVQCAVIKSSANQCSRSPTFQVVYYQVQTWLEHDLESQNWGWILHD